MTSLWQVVLLALLPAVGNLAGALVAEVSAASPRVLNWALHMASGIVIGIVAVELMPEALAALAGWAIAAAFAGGGVAYLLIESSIERLQHRRGGSEHGASTSMWMVYVAVAVDLSADGLMIGSGSATSLSLAAVLAAGQVLADVPEGYAAVANLRDNDVTRGRRMLLSGSFVLYTVVAALVSFLLLRDAPEAVQVAVLVFVAGLLTVAAIEDMLVEAHGAREDNRRSVLAFVGGFALFVLVSSGLDAALDAA